MLPPPTYDELYAAINPDGCVKGVFRVSMADNPDVIRIWGIGMITAITIGLFSATLFVLLIVSVFLGYHLGRKQRRPGAGAQGDNDNGGVGHISGIIFTLIGLLLGFTLSAAATGFQQRQVLIAQEANAIGTAYLRLDLLPKSAQAPLRLLFREYLQARLDTYKAPGGSPAAHTAYLRSLKLQAALWQQGTDAALATNNAAILTLTASALNTTFDITTTRLVAARTHPPMVIFILLFGVALIAALLAGYGMASSHRISWLQTILFATALSITLFTIMDMEYPRLGFIRVDLADRVLVDSLQGMRQ